VTFWLEALIAALLVSSGLSVLVSAIGFVRLKDFFARLHPPALAFTFGNWCVAVAGVLYFSWLESGPRLHPWLISLVTLVTVPVTTVILARAALFRRRLAGTGDTPAPLRPRD
jgi:multicomponent K+:H+ antiporter subunit G